MRTARQTNKLGGLLECSLMAEWERREKGGRRRKTGGTTREESRGVWREESVCLGSVRQDNKKTTGLRENMEEARCQACV